MRGKAMSTSRVQTLAEIVAGESIGLVGNSEALLRTKPGHLIDRHDLVIRINRGLPGTISEKAIGTRTSIWATAKYWPDLEAPKDCMAIMWMKLTPMGQRQLADLRASKPKIPVIEWPQKYEDECREYVGADPGTGIRLLWWLRTQTSARSVSVYGMDCWQVPSHWSGKKNTPNHFPELEREAMMRLL